jgi:hypothetical protein
MWRIREEGGVVVLIAAVVGSVFGVCFYYEVKYVVMDICKGIIHL